MKMIFGCLIGLIVILLFLLYLVLGMVRVSVLDRRNHRKEELAFYSKNAKTGQTVFLGDSITQYCPVEEVYAQYMAQSGSRVYNRGIASETSEDVLKRLDSNVIALKPAKLVILLGCNDIGKKISAEQTVSNVEKIIEKVREGNPDVHIILQAVYPVKESGNPLPAQILVGSRTCEKIKKLNIGLKELAERQKIVFVDLTDVLADSNGQLKEEYTADGLHVNEQAYQQIAAQIIPLLCAGKGKKNEEL